MNLELIYLQPTPENGKEISDFLANNFWEEHTLSKNKSPEIYWPNASAWINNFLFNGAIFNVIDSDKNDMIVGSVAVRSEEYAWSKEQYIGDGWFYVLPEYRNLKDQKPPSHLLLDAVIDYANKLELPLIMGIFNLEGVERAGKLFKKKGFHMIGSTYMK